MVWAESGELSGARGICSLASRISLSTSPLHSISSEIGTSQSPTGLYVVYWPFFVFFRVSISPFCFCLAIPIRAVSHLVLVLLHFNRRDPVWMGSQASGS